MRSGCFFASNDAATSAAITAEQLRRYGDLTSPARLLGTSGLARRRYVSRRRGDVETRRRHGSGCDSYIGSSGFGSSW